MGSCMLDVGILKESLALSLVLGRGAVVGESKVQGRPLSRRSKQCKFDISRIFWVICCFLGMVCCFWIGTPVYQQWYTKPTIITISDTNYPVWHIHFPAITICSNIRIIKSKLTQEVQDIYGPGFINKYYYGTAEEKAECNEVIEDFSSMLKILKTL